MGLLIAIGCFLGGGVVGAAAGLGLGAMVMWFASPPSEPSGVRYSDIPRRSVLGGLVTFAAILVAGTLLRRLPMPWELGIASLGAEIGCGASFAAMWLYTTVIAAVFQDAPD